MFSFLINEHALIQNQIHPTLGQIPNHAPRRRKSHCQQNSQSVQAGRVRLRLAASERQVVRVRRERLQLRQKFVQVLRRLGQNFGQHDPQRAGANSSHPLDDAVSARRPANRADDCRENVSHFLVLT